MRIQARLRQSAPGGFHARPDQRKTAGGSGVPSAYSGTCPGRTRVVIPTGAKRNGEPVLSEVERKSGIEWAVACVARRYLGRRDSPGVRRTQARAGRPTSSRPDPSTSLRSAQGDKEGKACVETAKTMRGRIHDIEECLRRRDNHAETPFSAAFRLSSRPLAAIILPGSCGGHTCDKRVETRSGPQWIAHSENLKCAGMTLRGRRHRTRAVTTNSASYTDRYSHCQAPECKHT
jgi:hypothetical protein